MLIRSDRKPPIGNPSRAIGMERSPSTTARLGSAARRGWRFLLSWALRRRVLGRQMLGRWADRSSQPTCNVDLAFTDPRGMVFVQGWIDDRAWRLEDVRLVAGPVAASANATLSRFHRADVNKHFRSGLDFDFGFWLLVEMPSDVRTAQLHFRLQDRSRELTKEIALSPVPHKKLLSFLTEVVAPPIGARRVPEHLRRQVGEPVFDLLRKARRQKATPEFIRLGHLDGMGDAGGPGVSIVILLRKSIEHIRVVGAWLEALGLSDLEIVYAIEDAVDIADLEPVLDMYRIEGSAPVTVVRFEQGAPPGTAINAAVKECRARCICVVESELLPLDRVALRELARRLTDGTADVVVGSNWEIQPQADGERTKQSLLSDPLCSFVGGQKISYDFADLGSRSDADLANGADWAAMVDECSDIVSAGHVAFRREAFDRIGGFSGNFLAIEYVMFDFVVRAKRSDLPVTVWHDLQWLKLTGEDSRSIQEDTFSLSWIDETIFRSQTAECRSEKSPDELS